MQSTRARAALFRLMAILMAGTAALEAHGQALTAEEVQRIISQSAAQAQALGVAGTIAVVDRVGNRLGVFQMEGARDTVLVTSGKGIPAGNGLENQPVPRSSRRYPKPLPPPFFRPAATLSPPAPRAS
jgi:hypothetical protein